MQQLYYTPGALSLAIHVLLNELNLPYERKPIDLKNGEGQTPEFLKLNPRGQVPVLVTDNQVIRETAAIIVYLTDEYNSILMPRSGKARANALEWLMFANSTLHNAYSKATFVLKNTEDATVKMQLFNAILAEINKLWAEVDAILAKNRFICGKDFTAADILLTVIANWGDHHPVRPTIGENTKRMLRDAISRPAFVKAIKVEQIDYKAAA